MIESEKLDEQFYKIIIEPDSEYTYFMNMSHNNAAMFTRIADGEEEMYLVKAQSWEPVNREVLDTLFPSRSEILETTKIILPYPKEDSDEIELYWCLVVVINPENNSMKTGLLQHGSNPEWRQASQKVILQPYPSDHVYYVFSKSKETLEGIQIALELIPRIRQIDAGEHDGPQ